MKVTCKLNGAKVRELSQTQIKAAAQTAEQMLHEIVTDAVIPFDTGQLQNVQTYVDTKASKEGLVKIVHDTPYANRLYYHPEYNFDKTINMNARGEWWEEWLVGVKKSRPAKLFKHFYNKLMGGI